MADARGCESEGSHGAELRDVHREEADAVIDGMCGAFNLLMCVAPPHEYGPHSLRVPPMPCVILPLDLAQRAIAELDQQAVFSYPSDTLRIRALIADLSEWVPAKPPPALRLVETPEGSP